MATLADQLIKIVDLGPDASMQQVEELRAWIASAVDKLDDYENRERLERLEARRQERLRSRDNRHRKSQAELNKVTIEWRSKLAELDRIRSRYQQMIAEADRRLSAVRSMEMQLGIKAEL